VELHSPTRLPPCGNCEPKSNEVTVPNRARTAFPNHIREVSFSTKRTKFFQTVTKTNFAGSTPLICVAGSTPAATLAQVSVLSV
jgi:hypothetical protein